MLKSPLDIARLAVLMSERYITDRFLPDKAIDLIDEACSDVNLRDKIWPAAKRSKKSSTTSLLSGRSWSLMPGTGRMSAWQNCGAKSSSFYKNSRN